MDCIYFETVFMILSPNKKWRHFFSSLIQGIVIVVIVYYFQIWNKKECSIIISRDIIGHMIRILYWDTLNISIIYVYDYEPQASIYLIKEIVFILRKQTKKQT